MNGELVSARSILSLAGMTTVLLLATPSLALADVGIWSAAAEWAPGRVLLGAAGVLLAAGLTGRRRD